MPYYAVAHGYNTGIFSNWTDCEKATSGFQKAIFKKFNTMEEAQKFIENATEKSDISTSNSEEENDDDFVVDYYVYTDGACSNNGQAGAVAGMGIYFGPNDVRNASMPVIGKQTNNTAELGALIHAYRIIKEDVLQGKHITIVSDSFYAINSVTRSGKRRELEGWVRDIPNKELVREAYEIFKHHSNIRFLQVKGHTGGDDIHSIGNDCADKLANKAIGVEECPYSSSYHKIYLNVPYAKKDDAKALGARWDNTLKLWYINSKHDNKNVLIEKYGVAESK